MPGWEAEAGRDRWLLPASAAARSDLGRVGLGGPERLLVVEGEAVSWEEQGGLDCGLCFLFLLLKKNRRSAVLADNSAALSPEAPPGL